ncbi:exonuclease subunit SbcD [Aquitalea magnusonii]|uniref:Nuclease SbcCD subunit D n=1 Tax=Aquitalea magnusonii TaxID=332411 RepID=A0A318JZ01_9NEIS|nr:exonuclease subunit SbcD [Aquitalea magnusonii]PXX51004.1 exodeoxyribonuclease I subunit D [Aquitalea magnusonii]
MRILHTSDWHLGQHFMGRSRQAEHQALIDWLLLQVTQQAIDAVLLAGDIFDTGAPPSYARELYNQLVVRLHEAGCQLVLLGGNHDSVATLEESRPLLAYLGCTVVPAVADDISRQLLTLCDQDGQPAALLCAVPFIRARDVLQSQAGQSAEEKQQGLQQAIAAHYQALYQLAVQERSRLGLPLPILATGHLTTVGASSSESVREIYVGALDAFPTNVFPPFDYIALGHIHRPQMVAGQAHVRYSGSPLALSFDELGQSKQMLLLELAGAAITGISPLAVPCFQPLCSLRGTLAQLQRSIPAAIAAIDQGQVLWLEVVVEGDDYLSDLQTRIQGMLDGQPAELLRLRRARSQQSATLQVERSTLDELSPQEVFERRLELEEMDDALAAQLRQRYQQVLMALQEEQA